MFTCEFKNVFITELHTAYKRDFRAGHGHHMISHLTVNDNVGRKRNEIAQSSGRLKGPSCFFKDRKPNSTRESPENNNIIWLFNAKPFTVGQSEMSCFRAG